MFRLNYQRKTTEVLTWIHAPVFSLHRLQMRDQRLGGMWEILVMGSILSGQAMLTCSGGKASPAPEGTTRSPQVSESYLRYPQSTADVRPFSACTCGLHGAALLWTEQTLGVDAQDTSPAQPVPKRDFDNAITGLGERGTQVTKVAQSQQPWTVLPSTHIQLSGQQL